LLSVLFGIIFDNYSLKECINYLLVLDGRICWNRPLWFLPVLFETELLMFFVRKSNPKLKYVIYLELLICVYLTQNITYFLRTGNVPIACVFYLAGKLFRWLYEKYFSKASKLQIALCILFPLTVNIVFGVVLNIRISVINSHYGNIYFCLIAGFAGTFAYLLIARLIGHNKLLEYWGKNTMFFLCTQYFFFRACQFISVRYFDYDLWHATSTIKALTYSIAVMAVSSLIILVLKKIPYNRFKQLIGV